MVPETFEHGLRALARRVPFQPFTVELLSGARIVVDHPEAMVFRGGLAVYVDRAGVPTLFDHESVSQLIGMTDQRAAS